MSLRTKLAKEFRHFHSHHVGYASKTPVFLYQMGKVGSTSVEEGLKAQGLGVRHIHSIGGDFADQFRFRRARASLARRWRKRLLGLIHARLLHLPNRPAKVITLVRDPLARNIAAFFQLFRRVLWEEPGFDTRKDIGARELVARAFETHFDHRAPLWWFPREIGRTLGIDVLAHPFERERGWTRILRGNIDLLVVRMEDLANARGAIAGFAGVPRLDLPTTNLGSRKWYADLYRDFREHYRPPTAMLDELYGSDFARHFYTPDEIAGFRRRWETPRG